MSGVFDLDQTLRSQRDARYAQTREDAESARRMAAAAGFTGVGAAFRCALHCRTFGGSLAGARVAAATEA